MITRLKGNLGENITVKALKKNGHKVLCRNYSLQGIGEIDIISRKGNYLVFTEVKTRNENALYSPAEAVNGGKQKRIIKTAQIYMEKTKSTLQPRFDVAEVVLRQKELVSINIIENAFGV